MMMWSKQEITSLQDVKDFIDLFNTTSPIYGGFDTETDGLHIRKNNPFLLIFGFINTELTQGHAFLIDLDNTRPLLRKVAVDAFINCFNKLRKVIAWNAKFDLHMLANFGRHNLFEHNITDAQIYVRLAHDAIPERFGGVTLKLTDYANKYIDKSASSYRREVSKARAAAKSQRNRTLQETLAIKTGKKWTMKQIADMLSDPVLELDKVPKEILPIVKEWLETTPDPNNYRHLPRNIVKQYAYMDVIYTLESFIQCLPLIKARGQQDTLKREEDLIYPLYRMERVGFSFNKKYAYLSKARVKRYILEKREELKELAGREISIGQHAAIKEVLNTKYGLSIKSTGAKILDNIKINNTEAKRFIQTIGELRTLEKWYSTYIVRWIQEEVGGRVYTSIHQTAAVSGRVASDFQQFPKSAIYSSDGVELFHPRRLIKVTAPEYPIIAYLDYSQIELRFQSIYTILVDGGDVNLTRAYMPFRCIERDGKWYLEEEPTKEWVPTDLHSLTTKMAFGVDETHPDWDNLRKMGKIANFACNYGASAVTLEVESHFPRDVAVNLHTAYLKAFPGVRAYRDYVGKILATYPFAENLFGRRYYGADAHKVSNYLIQGSAADFLKNKIIEIDNFLKPYKSRFQMNIHDELSFEIHVDELHLIFALKQIMEDLPQTLVPIAASVEITYSTWDAAKGVKYDSVS